MKEETKLSKHNYSQYSNKNHKHNHNNADKTRDAVSTAPVTSALELVDETVETVPVDIVEGVVVGCARLNVRAEPDIDAEVVSVLNAQSEMQINVSKSTDEWFHVCTASGIEGYCMRKYVNAYL